MLLYSYMSKTSYRQRLLRIMRRYANGKATSAEAGFIESYYDHFDAMNDSDDPETSPIEKLMTSEEQVLTEKSLWNGIHLRIAEMQLDEQKLRRLTIRPWVRWTAAAVVAGVLAGAGYLYRPSRPVSREKNIVVHDLQPGRTGALLTFTGGRPPILLDTARIGSLGDGVVKTAARVRVGDPGSTGGVGEIMYATLSTPRGRTQAVQLPDGSVAWLNAASSIRFPTRFTGGQRVVEVTGEVDIQVARNKEQPFRVLSAGRQWEVLGTEFNINIYDDEPVIRTTLLEGAVRVDGKILKPGQQAVAPRGGGKSRIDDNVSTEDAVAWKNGVFVFGNKKGLREVMREMARWYNVEVDYEGEGPDVELNGKSSRDLSASEALKILSYTTNLQFRIEGGKIVVARR